MYHLFVVVVVTVFDLSFRLLIINYGETYVGLELSDSIYDLPQCTQSRFGHFFPGIRRKYHIIEANELYVDGQILGLIFHGIEKNLVPLTL